MELFYSDQLTAWMKLQRAIEEADEIPPCTNFPDAYFPEPGAVEREQRIAQAMCETCPVKAMCFTYGYDYEDFGIWGGYSMYDIRRMRRGTYAA